MKRKLSFFIPLALILFALLFWYHHERKNSDKTGNAILVAVSPAAQKNLSVTVNVTGTVLPYNTVSVRAMVEGSLQQVAFQEGDEIKADQLLFTIDPRQYQAQLTQAQAKLASDQAQLVNAKAIVERNSKLLKSGYVAKQDFDTLNANVAVLAASVESDKAAVDNAQLQLNYCTIHAPIAGRAGAVLLNRGNLVKANDANSLVVINQIAPIYVQFALPEDYLSDLQKRLATGQVDVIAKARKDQEEMAKGQLSFVDNTVDASTGTILLKATFANKEHTLWPGQFVGVELTLRQLQNALVIPTRAVQSGQKGSYVYVLNANNTVQYRDVLIDTVVGEETAVKSGLKAGDKVVTDGQLNLVDGAKVRLTG